MNIKLPRRWTELHPGDMIVSKVPFHRLTKYQDAAEREGWSFRLDPHEYGYTVTCLRRPGCDGDRNAA